MQLNHNSVPAIAYPGTRYGLSTTRTTISRICETAAGARAGTYMVPGTDGELQAVEVASTGQISSGLGFGVVAYDMTKEPARTAAAIAAGNEYDTLDALPIITKGKVWVLCDAGAVITANSLAFVRFVTGAGGTQRGAFRQDVDTASAIGLPNGSGIFRSAHKDVSVFGTTYRIALLELT